MRAYWGTLLALLLLPSQLTQAEEQWQKVPLDSDEVAMTSIAIAPDNQRLIYATTSHSVYASQDDGKTWRHRFSLPGQVAIRRIAVQDVSGSAVLLATNQGVYGSVDGAGWKRLLLSTGRGEADCRFVAIHPDGRFFAATAGGLFMSRDLGWHWQEADMPMAARNIVHPSFDPVDPDRIWVVSVDGIYVGQIAQGVWTKRFGVLSAEETEVEEPEPLEDIETGTENGSLHRLSAVVLNPAQPGTLYIAGSRGVQRSPDGGLTWDPPLAAGLAAGPISRLLLQHNSPTVLYATTSEGISRYRVDGERWEPLPHGLGTRRINDIAVGSGVLWAATAEGLYRYALEPAGLEGGQPPSAQELLSNFVHEPTIGQVREAAIRYAEVHPDKIKRWRRRAALQALLPSIGFGFDHDRADNVQVDEGSFPSFQLLETQDRDYALGADVTWNLGELIWNPDQTSIDTRSKLMVELRDEIVDEVTRIYFERRRLQLALLTNPPTEQHVLVEKELRIQELTALLDGMTDGHFTEHMGLPVAVAPTAHGATQATTEAAWRRP